MKSSFLRRHYHWVIFVTLFTGFFCSIGLSNVRTSIFMIPVCEGLGVSRGVFSLSTSIHSVAAVFSNMFFGFLYCRLGYRKMSSLGIFVVALSWALCGFSKNIYWLYFASAIMGSVDCCVSMALTSRAITEWFNRARGLLLGIVMAASGLGGSLFSLIFSKIIRQHSFRQAYFLGSIILALTSLLVFLLVRNSPKDMGLEPFGGNGSFEKKKAKNVSYAGLPVSFLRKRPFFYLALGSIFLMSLGVYSMLSIVAPHVQDQGLGSDFAAKAQSVSFFAMAVVKILEGFLSDKLGARKVLTLALFAGAAGVLLFANAKSESAVIIAVLLYSFTISIPSVMIPLYAADLFGRLDYSVILGLFFSMISASSIINYPMINFSYDLLGSYTPALTVGAGLLLLSIFFMQLVYRRALKLREIYAAETNETL